MELNSKNIDCIWNGFTITDERKESCDFSKPYLTNEQVAVIRTADAGTYTSKAAFSGKKGAAEAESYGADCAEDLTAKDKITGVDTQMAALQNVKTNMVDFAVVDYTLANANCGHGDYSDLMICNNVSFPLEYYAVGYRKGSDLISKIDAALVELYADGTITTIATKYNLQHGLVEIK